MLRMYFDIKYLSLYIFFFAGLIPISLSTFLNSTSFQVNSDGKFTMVQFTDLHFGESEQNDLRSQKEMNDILSKLKPDLVVLTGDMHSNYAWNGLSNF